ncbi:MAG: NAD(P)-binding protein, partial [Clostridiales bacterium]|nr:NAD(P)-binding protein [Clostridiales bacterium]
MKIVFIGAGMAALVASEKLARHGYEVSVYEKNAYEQISYDWHDDVNKDAFISGGLPMPKDGTYFTKRNWTFIPPSERVEVTLDLPESELDLSIERRLLAQQYIDRAADVVDFHFGTSVEGLIIEDG